MKQTAVEYIKEKLLGDEYWYENMTFEQIFEQAKEMEKHQIVDAFSEGTRMIDVNDEMSAMLNGFIYYGETYEQDKQR
jgi:hypothetical protein